MGRSGQVGFDTALLRLKQRGIEPVKEWTGVVGCETDNPRALSTVTRKAWVVVEDGIGKPELHEHREIVAALSTCPTCGKTVECLADTDGWTETFNGSRVWRHNSYGPAMGECSTCEVLIADEDPSSPFMSVFDVSRRTQDGDAS